MLIISGIIVWALSNIPYVGWIISIITSVLGLGILICSIIPKRNKIEEKSISDKK